MYKQAIINSLIKQAGIGNRVASMLPGAVIGIGANGLSTFGKEEDVGPARLGGAVLRAGIGGSIGDAIARRMGGGSRARLIASGIGAGSNVLAHHLLTRDDDTYGTGHGMGLMLDAGTGALAGFLNPLPDK